MLQTVDAHGVLYVGMRYETGVIHEMYPSIDNVTVRITHGEIQHLQIGKVLQKIESARSKAKADIYLDSLD